MYHNVNTKNTSSKIKNRLLPPSKNVTLVKKKQTIVFERATEDRKLESENRNTTLANLQRRFNVGESLKGGNCLHVKIQLTLLGCDLATRTENANCWLSQKGGMLLEKSIHFKLF